MLVGNKCDESAELREVTQSEGQAESASWGVSFMETSAKTNHNVTELFQVITIIIIIDRLGVGVVAKMRFKNINIFLFFSHSLSLSCNIIIFILGIIKHGKES